MNQALDPVTLEVLRHRLWLINDEQGRVGAHLSGSPVVYESKDFNSALQTPSGDSLFIGVYTTRLSLCLDGATKAILERFSESPGLEDGDAFITNDPWVGAAHMNDILMVAPIFAAGRLVAWAGLAMHEVDVGGPNPGSFTVGARDIFGEGPIIPPVKIVERGQFRPDIEAWAVRNTRTPEMNALNLRARWAAISRTRQRLLEVIGEYGVDTFLAVQERILELTSNAFRRRLQSLPDGVWLDEGFLDHDGNSNEVYRICLCMTKQRDKLTFDFRGTSPQARGSVNCTAIGMRSGVLSAVLPALCFDMPWSPAAICQAMEFVSEPGTINNAIHPAGASMATIASTFATQHVAAATIGKMLACSELRDEAQANWAPAWQGVTIAGTRDDGSRFTGVLLGQAGGGGAGAVADGVDTAGSSGSPSTAIANVETYEHLYPILFLYRKESTDTGGAGRWRGGVGSEWLMVPHKAGGALDVTVLSHGASQPEARGLYGGQPSSVQVRLIVRDMGARELLAKSEIPRGLGDMNRGRLEPLAAKQRTLLNLDDALILTNAGGGGYGDPLDREPELVVRDVARGLVSARAAEDIYGVCLSGGAVVTAQTGMRRSELRAQRLGGAVSGTIQLGRDGQSVITVGDALIARPNGTGWGFACLTCGYDFGLVLPKDGCIQREVPMTELSDWNRFGWVDEFVVREFYCPACAHLMSVEVRRKDDPILLDTQLMASTAKVPEGESRRREITRVV